MILTSVINFIIISLAVAFHYEVLNHISKVIPRLPIPTRARIIVGVIGSLVAHILEVWLFALGYYLMIKTQKMGELRGNFDGSLLDCSYFSFTTYTTLGFGDIEPFGDIRFLVGLEALTGLVLITWTASFLFLEMQKSWATK